MSGNEWSDDQRHRRLRDIAQKLIDKLDTHNSGLNRGRGCTALYINAIVIQWRCHNSDKHEQTQALENNLCYINFPSHDEAELRSLVIKS